MLKGLERSAPAADDPGDHLSEQTGGAPGMEPQTGAPHLLRIGTEPADQAKKAGEKRKARTFGRARSPQ